MRLIKSTLLAFFAVMLCLASNCKREQKLTHIYRGPFYLGEIKDYLYFKPGSWWVYKNSLSGETDSVVQTFCDTQFFPNKYEVINGKAYHNAYTLLDYEQHSYRNDCHIFFVSKGPAFDLYKFGGTFNKTCQNPLSGGVNYDAFSYPFNNDGGFTNYLGKLDTLTVSGFLYNDVQVFEVDIDASVNKPTTTIPIDNLGKSKYYWARNFGLIKVEISVWRFDTQQPLIHSWYLIKTYLKK